MASEIYTLVIPTYNRAESLARLLRYISAHNPDFRVRVLDSSRPDVRIANRNTIAALPIRCEYVEFPESTHPFDKFREGIGGVTTPLCGLCADDDVLVIEGLEASIRFLAENEEYSVAHGYYFQFSLNSSEINIANITYYTPSYTMRDPLERVHALMRHYQALTYGTYRTEVLARIFDLVRPVESILGRELLSSVLAAVHGKVARLPVIFHGRNLGPSSSYTNWHPLEWLIRDPSGLFREYVTYRDIILEEVIKFKDCNIERKEIQRVIDLIHSQYFVRHAPDECFDNIVLEVLRGAETEAIFGSPIVTHGLIRAASQFRPAEADPSRSGGPAEGLAGAAAPALWHPAPSAFRHYVSRLARSLDQAVPALATLLRRAKRALGSYAVTQVQAPGADTPVSADPRPRHLKTDRRSYVVAAAFLRPDPAFGVELDPAEIDRLLQALDRYH